MQCQKDHVPTKDRTQAVSSPGDTNTSMVSLDQLNFARHWHASLLEYRSGRRHQLPHYIEHPVPRRLKCAYAVMLWSPKHSSVGIVMPEDLERQPESRIAVYRRLSLQRRPTAFFYYWCESNLIPWNKKNRRPVQLLNVEEYDSIIIKRLIQITLQSIAFSTYATVFQGQPRTILFSQTLTRTVLIICLSFYRVATQPFPK